MLMKTKIKFIIYTVLLVFALALAVKVYAPNLISFGKPPEVREGRKMAEKIQNSAKSFSLEKGKTFRSWEHLNIHDIGFTKQELAGKYLKPDSYSISFFGYNDFLVKVKVPVEASEGQTLKFKTITVDENNIWGYIE